jgi:hypothetical protein
MDSLLVGMAEQEWKGGKKYGHALKVKPLFTESGDRKKKSVSMTHRE